MQHDSNGTTEALDLAQTHKVAMRTGTRSLRSHWVTQVMCLGGLAPLSVDNQYACACSIATSHASVGGLRTSLCTFRAQRSMTPTFVAVARAYSAIGVN